MMQRGVNCPRTSSVGRLFDGVAALVGLDAIGGFEGKAAMALEFALADAETDDAYRFEIRTGEPLVIDWEPVVLAVLRDLENGSPPGLISARFHNGLVEALVEVARLVGREQVALSGGCFQNKYLLERAVTRLENAGLKPYWHQRVPSNDGGISLGQIAYAARTWR